MKFLSATSELTTFTLPVIDNLPSAVLSGLYAGIRYVLPRTLTTLSQGTVLVNINVQELHCSLIVGLYALPFNVITRWRFE